VIIFDLVRFLSKKVTEPKKKIFKKKTGSNRPVSVRFGSIFLGQKPVQTGLARFFRFGSVFSVWLGFSGLARFFFRFFAYKTKTEPNRLIFLKF
jgi:hypothetical protein